MTTDRIEKKITLRAPRSRVWRAISRSEEFGAWFRVALAPRRLRARRPREGEHHLPRLRAPGHGHHRRADGAGAAVLVPLAPGRGRSRRGLLRGAHHAGGASPRGGPGGHRAHGGRVRVRRHPAGPPRRGVPDERGRLGRAAARTSSAMSPRSARAPRLAAAAPLFAALGDETRLALVARLCAGGPRSIAQLSAGSAVTRQAITEAPERARRRRPVRGTRRGRERIWEIEPERLGEARRCLDLISPRWDEALERLRALTER